MLYTPGDTLTAEKEKTGYGKLKIENGVLVFDKASTDLQFVSLPGRKEIKEVHFTEPQPNLKYLDVSRCEIENIRFTKDCCPQLISLYLHQNSLATIGFDTRFPSLQLMDLNKNKELAEISVGNMSTLFPELKYLYLHGCNLKTLQPFARFFIKDGNDFNVEENEGLVEPPLAIVKQGKDGVRNYFKQIVKDEETGEVQ